MDLLHKKISEVGDIVYFICSPIEEPYYFVRLRGEIMEVTVTDEHVSYRLKLVEIVEPMSIIRDCMCGKHFRMKCMRRKTSHYLDKMVRGSDFKDTELASGIVKRLSKNWFDVSIMTTFHEQDDMDNKLSIINQYNIDRLTNRVDFLSKRSLSL